MIFIYKLFIFVRFQKLQSYLYSTISIFIENRLVTIGGYGDRRAISSVEVTNEEKKLSCNVDSFPYTLFGHSASIIPTGILVCGGLGFGGNRNRCYEYKKTTASWQRFPSMTTERYYFDMIFLNQHIWAVGGFKSPNTLDKLDINTKVWTKHRIPMSVDYHCLTKLTHEKLILIGGWQKSVSKK